MEAGPEGLSRAVPERLVVGMTGIKGAWYGIRLLEVLRDLGVESHLVMCGCSKSMIEEETEMGLGEIRALATGWYDERNQAARISSGSFLTRGMVIVPCTIRSLSAVVTGVADNLVQRAADVTLKEGRRLMLLLAEQSLSPIGQENVARAERAGVRIFGVDGMQIPGSCVRPARGTQDPVVSAIVDYFGFGDGAGGFR